MTHFTRLNFEGIRAIDSRSCLQGRNKIEIEPGRINVIIGENGAGKSTVLDVLHALFDKNKLCSLKTENAADAAIATCTYERGADTIQILFSKYGADDFNFQNFAASLNGKLLTPEWLRIPKVGRPDQGLDTAISLLAQYGGDIVHIDRNTLPINDNVIADELNRLGPLLVGLASEFDPDKFGSAFDKEKISRPIRFGGNHDKYSVYLKSDLVQPSIVPLNQFPGGWIRYGTICQALASARNGSVILLDEPEVHLHPKLQHKLMQRIFELASESDKNLQIFIATHSNVFINSKRWVKDEAKIYWVKDKGLSEVTSNRGALERLGFKASDLLQTDGIIWVEGPSDRLYIEHWLNIWCAQAGKKRFIENIDYSYSLYGGSILSHFQVGEDEDLIDVLKINPNAYMVIDNDNDFGFDQNGNPVPINVRSAKARIYNSLKSAGGASWITREYTIESYLVPAFRDIYFESKDGKLILRQGCRKVVAAEKYPKEKFTTDERLAIDDLKIRISELYNHIAAWSTY